MNNYHEAPAINLESPSEILAQAIQRAPTDQGYFEQPLIQCFGSPEQPIYVDQGQINLDGTQYENPMILPIYNGELALIQCAFLQYGMKVTVFPDDGLAQGFASYGNLQKNQPVVITHNLEAYFKIAQTGYAVVLVILPSLCYARQVAFNKFDFQQIQFVINQLLQAGYQQLYMPVRSEHILLEPFQQLEQNKGFRLLNQYQKIGESEFLIELCKEDDVREVTAFIGEAITSLTSKPDQWQEPIPINSELLPVKQLTPDMLPIELDRYCRDEARRADNMTPDFIAVCLLTSLGALIGARVAVKPKQLDDYSLVPNLWGGIIAPPSSKKSPAIKAGTRHLDHLVANAKKGFDEAKQNHYAEELLFRDKQLELKKVLQRTVDENEKRQIALELAKLQEDTQSQPVLKRYFTNDSTPEALADLERTNPNGILVIRDELIGLLSSLDQNDTDTGRAFYLEGWNGTGSYQFDRIIRGSGLIENHCLSLLGGIQPDKLIGYLDKSINGLGNDGLLQRFQLLIYPDLLQWEYVDQAINKQARKDVFNLFQAIDELTDHELVRLGAKPKDEFNDRPYFRFARDAQELYKAWSQRLYGQVIPNEEHAIIQEHLSKFGKLMPSLALIFHLIDCVNCGVPLGGISTKSTEMAIAWCDYLESHARRIYGLVLQSASMRAGILCKKLKRLAETDQWRVQGFNARDVHRKNWKSLTEIEAVYDALNLLVDSHWLTVQEIEPTIKGGRPTKKYFINPKIFLES